MAGECCICGSSKFFCQCHEQCPDRGEYTLDCQCDKEETVNSVDRFDRNE